MRPTNTTGTSRVLAVLGGPALLVLLVFSGLRTGWPTQAQSSGAALLFQGSLQFSGTPAPAGTQVTVITARSPSDVTQCGQGSVNDASGDYSAGVQAIPFCGTKAGTTNPGPYVFVAEHQNVGNNGQLLDLTEPGAFGPGPNRQPLSGTSMPGALPSTDFGPLGMPAAWFTGVFTLGGSPATQGTPISVQAQNGGSPTMSCGQGSVVDGQGDYIAYVNAAAGCAANGGSGPRVEGYLFSVGGETVGNSGTVPDLRTLTTLGLVNRLSLSGQQIGDVFVSGTGGQQLCPDGSQPAPDGTCPMGGPQEEAPPLQASVSVTATPQPAPNPSPLPSPNPSTSPLPEPSSPPAPSPSPAPSGCMARQLATEADRRGGWEQAPPCPVPGTTVCPAVQAYLQSIGDATDNPVPLLGEVCMIGDAAFQAAFPPCVNRFHAAVGSQAATIVSLLNQDPSTLGIAPHWVLVGPLGPMTDILHMGGIIKPERTLESNATVPRQFGNDQNGVGTDALMGFDPGAGVYQDGLARDVCASFIHELAHALQINSGTLDNSMVQLDTATPAPPYADSGMTAGFPRRELVAVTVENCWRQANALPLRQRYYRNLMFFIMPPNVANPPNCTWPVIGLP